jgi:hypothetical protein
MMMHSFRRLLGIAGGALITSALLAQTPTYFPLQAGNSWVYRLADDGGANGNVFRSISVMGCETINGREYFHVDYFGRPIVLRTDPDGSIIEYSRESGAEQSWLSPQLPENSTFPTHIDNCTDSGAIVSRTAHVATSAGEFDNTVQVKFHATCTDAGTTQQFYAPNVGLVRHEETSFAGPKAYELVYYHAGTSTGSAQELSFTISLDRARYPANSVMGVRLTLRNTTPDPVTLHFPSGQSYDLKIINEQGGVGYTWSADKLFPMIVHDETVGPGEKTFAFDAPLRGLPPGRYKAQAYLTTEPLMFLGEGTFDISVP